jgi:hypothetical protein
MLDIFAKILDPVLAQLGLFLTLVFFFDFISMMLVFNENRIGVYKSYNGAGV